MDGGSEGRLLGRSVLGQDQGGAGTFHAVLRGTFDSGLTILCKG